MSDTRRSISEQDGYVVIQDPTMPLIVITDDETGGSTTVGEE